MKRIILLILHCAMVIIASAKYPTFPVEAPLPDFVPQIVNVTQQIYTHSMLLNDLKEISNRFSSIIKVSYKDTTAEGRPIPVVRLGELNARYNVMIQASMHAREYINVQLVVALIEYYARAYEEDGNIGGYNIANLLKEVSFTILPSVNPDGIAICQFAEKGAIDTITQKWVCSQIRKGVDYHKIKSNGRGVDLNRNFSNGFDKPKKDMMPSFIGYPGKEPYSEIETRLMLSIARESDALCFINYHSRGNLIYYGCKNATSAVNNKAHLLASIIKNCTGYPLYGPDSAPPCGSWADEVETLLKKPSATIETGTRTPVPIKEFPSIFRKNKNVWAHVAFAIIKGRI